MFYFKITSNNNFSGCLAAMKGSGSDGDNGAHENVDTSTPHAETPASPANATKKQFVQHLVVDSGAIITGVPLENLATVRTKRKC